MTQTSDPHRANRMLHKMPMRVGRKLGRTLYFVTGDGPDKDVCVGIVDTPEIAAAICTAMNAVTQGLTQGQAPWRRGEVTGTPLRPDQLLGALHNEVSGTEVHWMRTTITISVEIDKDAYLEEHGLDDNADPGEYIAYTIATAMCPRGTPQSRGAARTRLAAIGGWARVVKLTTAAA